MKKILKLAVIPLLLGGLILAPATLPTSCGCSSICGVSSAHAAESGTTHLALDGLTCAACKFAVKGALSRLDGVSQVNVGYQEKKATVVYDPAKVTPRQLLDAVRRSGFQAELLTTTNEN